MEINQVMEPCNKLGIMFGHFHEVMGTQKLLYLDIMQVMQNTEFHKDFPVQVLSHFLITFSYRIVLNEEIFQKEK